MSLKKFLKVHEPHVIQSNCSVNDEMAYYIRSVCDCCGPPLLMKDEEYSNWVVGGVYATEDRIRSIFSYLDNNIAEPLNNLSLVKRFVEADDFAISNSVSFQNGSLKFLSIMDEKDCPNKDCSFSFNTQTPDTVDLHKLPICKHNEKDIGKFITAGVNVVEGIDKKTQGLGIHRMQVIDKNTISCLAPPNRRVGVPFYEASKAGKSIKMAVVIGAPPEVVLASQSKIPQDKEKYLVASHIRGCCNDSKKNRLKLVRLDYSGLLVPRESELVLECESIPNSLHEDIPFGEYPGTYSFRSNAWKLKVKYVHCFKNFLYQTILTGKVPQEDSNLCAIPYSADVYKIVSKFAKVTDISVFLGNNVFDTIVCIKKESNSQIQNIMYSLLGNKYLKSITIMDEDMKANDIDWRFAFNTRFQPNRDVIITNPGLGASLDPSSPLFQSTSKIAFDFTVPIGNTEEESKLNWFRHKPATPKIIRDDKGYLIKYN